MTRKARIFTPNEIQITYGVKNPQDDAEFVEAFLELLEALVAVHSASQQKSVWPHTTRKDEGKYFIEIETMDVIDTDAFVKDVAEVLSALKTAKEVGIGPMERW